MSASKSDRLGRNPFDRGTYTEQAAKPTKPSKSAKTKAKPKKSASDSSGAQRARADAPPWRALLNELDRRAPQAVRDLKICKRVARLADFASSRLSQFARHLEA